MEQGAIRLFIPQMSLLPKNYSDFVIINLLSPGFSAKLMQHEYCT